MQYEWTLHMSNDQQIPGWKGYADHKSLQLKPLPAERDGKQDG